MARFTAAAAGLFLPILAALAPASASSDVQVKVYSGPTECANAEGEDPTKVEVGSVVGFHFTVTVDESSQGAGDVPGRKIESSRDRGIAPSIPVGLGKVITGLDHGLIGLCKGASAHIIVPPHLGYGRIGKTDQGVGPETILRYDVEIITIQPPAPNDFGKIDANGDWEISREEAEEYFEKQGQAINLDNLWKDEDKDGDGFISWQEFSGPKGSEGPPPKQPQQQQQASHLEQMANLFENVDKNKDQLLSKAELAEMFRQLGSEMDDNFWEESDPDGDGHITFDEFVGKKTERDEL
ncbi:hypothetical protein ACHAXT_000815 [Thalassiosira profunda]